MRLRGINAQCSQCLTINPLASWYQFSLLGEQGLHSVSSLSRAIRQEIGGLRNRTGDPPIPGPIPKPHNHWPTRRFVSRSLYRSLYRFLCRFVYRFVYRYMYIGLSVRVSVLVSVLSLFRVSFRIAYINIILL